MQSRFYVYAFVALISARRLRAPTVRSDTSSAFADHPKIEPIDRACCRRWPPTAVVGMVCGMGGDTFETPALLRAWVQSLAEVHRSRSKGSQALVEAARALVFVFPPLARCLQVRSVHGCTAFTGAWVHGCMGFTGAWGSRVHGCIT